MATNQPALRSFVPPQLVEWLAGRLSDADDTPSDQVELVSWFADLSDFSRTTGEITQRDRAGPEAVGDLLNRTFGAIIGAITGHGGEVYDFAGDAVLATWRVGHDGDRALPLTRASRCALEVLQLELPKIREQLPGLNMRIGIGVGTATYLEVGGVDGQWMFVAGGAPFNQIGLASSAARPGEVVLSPEATRSIDDRVSGHIDQNGFMRLADVVPLDRESPQAPAELTPELESEVRRFVAPAVLRRIDASQSEWLAEFRQVTSVFVNLPGMDLQSAESRYALQDVVVETQRALGKFEGTLKQVIDDDKGVTIVSAFGLPPFSHEEDPYLAVQAAETIQDSLRQMKLAYGIGVATGRAFCGATGSTLRRNYTSIGSDVNLAARLMKAAQFEILCDEATARAARRVEFHDLGERTFRGWDQPLKVFKPLWEKRAGAAEIDIPESLVGRDSELNQLTSWLGALARARSSSVVVIEGDAGIGKSALAGKLIETARELDVRVLMGAALPVAQAPYQAWRQVMSDILDMTEIRSQQRRRELVGERLNRWPQFLEWEALLNSVLDSDFAENATTRGMSGDNRRESTVELLVALLSDAAEAAPLMIVLDDVQWMDSASWAVTLGAARKVSPLLLVLVTRPNPEQEMLDDLSSIGTSAHLVLGHLEREDTLELARRTLQVDRLAPEVADLIEKTSEGVPFFVEELAYSLRDGDSLRIEGGTAHLARPADELGVPHSLSSVVLSRIDGLSPDLQQTLKVASVLGRSFDAAALAAAHPSHPEGQELESHLDALARLDLVVESEPGSFDFRHAVTRETAYDLLPFDLRRRIHLSVAGFLESRGDQERELNYALLAYHWDRGDHHRNALGYYERTGASALRKGANLEAIQAHTRSLELFARHREELADIGVLHRSQWHLEIAQAEEALSNFDEAEKRLYQALDLLDVKVGSGTVGRMTGLAWEAAKQIVHIVLPALVRTPQDDAEKARLAQASRVAALIGEIYYFQGNLSGFPLLNLMAINLGEKSGEPLIAGLAYSNLGYLVGTLRLRRLARRYFDRARRAEDLEAHPQLVAPPYVLELHEMGPGHLIAVALAESVLALTFGELAEAREIVSDGLARCVKLGDKYSAGIALAVRGFVHYSSGQIEDARIDYNQLLASAHQRANREHEGWATTFSIPVLLAQGKVDEARKMAGAAISILDDVDKLTVPIIHGTRSQVLLETGQTHEARASAELASKGFDSSPFFIYVVGFAGTLDTMLRLIEADGEISSAEASTLVDEARAVVRKLRRFARILPFARPKYWLFKGRLESLEGHRSRALRSFRKGLTRAQSSGFIWDEGLLHLEMARISEPGSAERDAAVAKAIRLFEEVGSAHDLERVAALEV